METVVERDQTAPGCFGSPSAFTTDSAVCQRCVAFDGCQEQSLQTLERIKGAIKIDDLLKAHRAARERMLVKRAPVAPVGAVEPNKFAAAASEELAKAERPARLAATMAVAKEGGDVVLKVRENVPPPAVGEIPKKAQEFSVAICKFIDLKKAAAELVAGNNPFQDDRYKFLHLTVAMLLRDKKVSKNAIRAELVGKLGWTQGTADSHISILIGFFRHFGLVKEAAGLLWFTPANFCDNKDQSQLSAEGM